MVGSGAEELVGDACSDGDAGVGVDMEIGAGVGEDAKIGGDGLCIEDIDVGCIGAVPGDPVSDVLVDACNVSGVGGVGFEL